MPSKPKHAPYDGIVHPRWLFTVRALALVAFAISAYLVWVSLAGGSVVGCGPDSGCDKVLGSRWSKWFGVPVSFGALAVYASIFAATFRIGGQIEAARQRQAWRVLVPAAVLVLGAALWFAALQFVVLKAICPYCLTAHACGLVVALVILFNAPFRNAPEKQWQIAKQVFVSPAQRQKLALAAVAGIAALAAGQLAYKPKTFVVTQLVAPGTINTTVLSSASTTPTAQFTSTTSAPPVPQVPGPLTALVTHPVTGREFDVFGGAVRLNLKEVPMMGSPDAPYVMLSLFDYSCRSCRMTHWTLMKARRALGDQLAIISLPMPLDPQCNFTVKTTNPDHVNACDYAHTGLTVWRADRSKLELFDNWIFSLPEPPPPEFVRQYAAVLVGTNEFAKAQADPWIERQLQQGISIYATNYLLFHQGQMPQLFIGTNVIVGEVESAKDLYPILTRQLGTPIPAPQEGPSR